MPLLLFIAGALAAAATAAAVFRVRHPAALSIGVMAAGWLAGELALFHLAAQVITTTVLIALGALDDTKGWIGLGLMILSWIGLVRVHLVATATRSTFLAALEPTRPEAAEQLPEDGPGWRSYLAPFRFDKTGLEVTRDVAYGPAERHRLDIYRPDGTEGEPRPVLVYVHGGAWVSGTKEHQGLPLLHAAARAGWVAVAATYRLGPKHRLPEPLGDVDAALRWVQENIAVHGGDPAVIAIAGNSAGGHLAALAALRDDSPSVQACIPIYGAFDLTDHLGIRGYARMTGFLQRMVMPSRLNDDPAQWEAMSPFFQVNEEAPPFFIVHGTHDVFLYREETRAFVEHLRQTSRRDVVYAELPGGQHAFDVFHSVRSQATVDAVIAYLATIRADTAQ